MTLANGLGGFADDGRAYAIVLDGDEETPLPWANVIANPDFGTIVTASGAAHTWSENSRENRLTSVRERSGRRPDSRSAVHPRRRVGRRVVADAGADAARNAASGRFVIRHAAGVTRFSRGRAASATSSTCSSTSTIR